MKTSTSIPRIYADRHGLKHADLSEKLIGIFFNIYNELGHGFLESVYEQAFSVSLAEQGIFFERQIAVPVFFHQQKIGDFRADLLVDSKILIELKTGRDIDPAWEKQLLNYLRATKIEVGLLFNFGPQAQFRRYVFENERKNPRKSA
ncbi:MAG TPA: GxxExxY protein [Terriglobales bacterium]|nr:GxxExxY protein [Terriglobales bacterium]